MTREEAAAYLRSIMENASLPNYQAALRLAVEALEGREVPALHGDKKLVKGQRLTYQIGEYWQIEGADGAACDVVCEHRGLSGCDDCPIQTAFDRLAAYEDTMPLERAQELAKAEKDGRLVVLPCKVGDFLYEVDAQEYGVITCKVLSIYYHNGPMFHVPGNDVVSALSVEVEVIDGHGKGSSYNFELRDFGKTVFLTCEEAETALKKRKDDTFG